MSIGHATTAGKSTFVRVYSLVAVRKGLYGLLELFASAMMVPVTGLARQYSPRPH